MSSKTNQISQQVTLAREYHRTGDVTLRSQAEETIRELASRHMATRIISGMYSIDQRKPILRAQSQDCGPAVAICNATADEVAESQSAGDEGYIDVDGITCYVEE